MRCLVTILLLASLRLSAAVGDLIGLEVETNGWVLRATISGLNTNGNFFNGFGTNNSITGTQKLTLTVTSPGFSDSAASNTLTRTIYGTEALRAVFPMQNTNDIQPQGGDSVWRIALSEFVMSNDVVTASALAGYCAVTNGNGTNANAFTAQTVTNGSVMSWSSAKSIANWSYPGYQSITQSTMRLRAVGFNRFAMEGRPLRAMKFIARDQSGNAVTNLQTQMQIDLAMGDANPVPEYIADMDISTFTNGDLIRCDFEAYPWAGDTTSVQSTLDNVFANSANYCSQTNLCDRLLTYGTSYALVASNGVAGGVVVSNYNYSVAWATPFDTIGHALDAIVRSNAIWFGLARSNSGNSRVLLSNGTNFSAWGNAPFYGPPYVMPAVIITHYPTNTRYDCTIYFTSNSTDSRHKNIVLRDIVLGGGTFAFNADANALWMDRCTLNMVTAGGYRATNSYTTQCIISNLASGFAGAGHAPALIRGNWFYNTNDCPMRTYTQIGNRRMVNMHAAVAAPSVLAANNLTPPPDRPICAFNSFLGMNAVSFPVRIFDDYDCTNGAAFVQNVVENTNAAGATRIGVFSSAAGSTNSTNMIIWGNVFVGNGVFLGYNDVGSSPWWRYLWSVKNNLWDSVAVKADAFTTGNGARIGNWPIVYGVGMSGNVCPTTYDPLSVFLQEFSGLRSLHLYLNQTNWFQFRDLEASGFGFNPREGQGNYRLRNDSPVWAFTADWVMSHDLEGNARSASDPPGAYVARAMPFSLIGKAGWSGKGVGQ